VQDGRIFDAAKCAAVHISPNRVSNGVRDASASTGVCMQFREGTFTVLLALPVLVVTVGCNENEVRQLKRQNQELGAKLNNVEKENQELAAKLNGVTKGASLELQKKCADQSASEFKTWGWNKKPLAGYINHYQRNLNKCFVRIEDLESSNHVPATSITVSDAFEGKVYGDYYEWINTEGKKEPSICRVTLLSGEAKFCHSKEEFDQLVKVYMEQ
jgi:hypothetical protein